MIAIERYCLQSRTFINVTKKSTVPLKKVTVNLYAGDLERLEELFPLLDKSTALREVLRGFIKKIEEDAITNLRTQELSL